jgi:hypothetical protein
VTATRAWTYLVAGCLLAFVAAGFSACSSLGAAGYYEKRERVTESASHMSGEALAQKKLRMHRTQRDLIHIQKTLRNLRRHRYLMDIELFDGFVRLYLAEQVDPLLSEKSES